MNPAVGAVIKAIVMMAVTFTIPFPVLAGPFDGWTVFASDDKSTWFYFPGSVKPIHHAQTGKYLGVYAWAGWQNADGSYAMGHYGLYCGSDGYTLEGFFVADASGKESPGQDLVFNTPARPNTFPYLLARKVCPSK